MKKAIKVIITIFKIIIILALMAELIYLSMAVFNIQVDNKFHLQKGRYGANPTWLDDAESVEADTIYASLNA